MKLKMQQLIIRQVFRGLMGECWQFLENHGGLIGASVAHLSSRCEPGSSQTFPPKTRPSTPHLIGQTQPVIAYRMLTRSTIAEKIMTLQQKKNLMISNVLGEGGFTNLLQKEDFEFLFDIEASKVT